MNKSGVASFPKAGVTAGQARRSPALLNAFDKEGEFASQGLRPSGEPVSMAAGRQWAGTLQMTESAPQKTVCVIDDDDLVRAHLAEQLRAAGWRVFEAGTVDEGVALIRQNRAQAAVVDILMPDRDGLEAIGQLRKVRPDLRIVAISGGGRVGAEIYLGLASRIGADAALQKPLDSQALLAALGG